LDQEELRWFKNDFVVYCFVCFNPLNDNELFLVGDKSKSIKEFWGFKTL